MHLRLVGLGVGLFAGRAAKSTKAIPVLTEALTEHFTRFASHCSLDFFCALHSFIIQLTVVVSQRKSTCAQEFFLLYLDGVTEENDGAAGGIRTHMPRKSGEFKARCG